MFGPEALMASPLHKRLQRLEEALASRINAPIAWKILGQDETEADAYDRLIAAGEIGEADRGRVQWIQTWRMAANLLKPLTGSGELPHAKPADIAAEIVTEITQRSEPPERWQDKYETEEEYRLRLKREERRIMNEKLAEHADKVARSLA
jgi:hypothetical protein